MMKKIQFLTLAIFFAGSIVAQNVGIGTTTPNASAALEVKSSNKGLLVPRVALMGTNDVVTISSPVVSLLVYNTALAGTGLSAVTPGFYFWNGSNWINISSGTAGSNADGWQLSGNSGTDLTTNFIGTTDNKPVRFRINNFPAGGMETSGQTFFGLNAGKDNTGSDNAAFGGNALSNNTTGKSNAAIGIFALVNNTTGSNNIANGKNALFFNSSGSGNVAVGVSALQLNLTASNLVAIGDSALFNNGNGTLAGQASFNTAIGSKALFANITGSANTAVGFQSLFANTTGFNNASFGYFTMVKNKTGSFNTAVGDRSLYSNISGGSNTAIGATALYNNTTGRSNTAIGDRSLYSDTSGKFNTATGAEALQENTSGNYNVAIGAAALLSNLTGSNNTALGFDALLFNSIGTNNTAVGYQAMRLNNSGDYNAAYGYQSLYSNTTGQFNTANGYVSLYSNEDGNYNTASGYQSLYNNTSGSRNTAQGSYALGYNTTGSNNTAMGNLSLASNTTGVQNSATGDRALYSNTEGNYNMANGYNALKLNTTGNQNTGVGALALNLNTTGINNTAIGYNADVAVENLYNATAIGSYSTVGCNNCLVLGSVKTSGFFATSTVNVGIGTTTPQTFLHVNPDGAGSILIGTDRAMGGFTNLEMGISAKSAGYSYLQSTAASGSAYGSLALNPSGGNVGVGINTALAALHIKQRTEAFPVNGGGLRLERLTNTNHWDIGTDNGDDIDFAFNGAWRCWFSNIDGALSTSSDLRLKKDIELIGPVLSAVMQLQPKAYHYKDAQTAAPLSYGFIAQEVEKLFPDFVKTKGDNKMKGITYQYFSVIAIKAIQEQQQQIEAATEKNKVMMQLIEKIQLELEALKQKIK